MVLSAGRVVEFDSPEKLLDNPDSVFAGMAKEAGLVNSNNSNSNNKETNVRHFYETILELFNFIFCFTEGRSYGAC